MNPKVSRARTMAQKSQSTTFPELKARPAPPPYIAAAAEAVRALVGTMLPKGFTIAIASG
jgi:hypothetical protein